MRTRVTVRTAPRSNFIQAQSPSADHRVPRLLSTVLPGTLPSLVLAVTPEAGGVTSTSEGGAVGVAVGAGVGVGRGVGVAVGAGVGVGRGVGVGVGRGVGVACGAPPQFAGSASANVVATRMLSKYMSRVL